MEYAKDEIFNVRYNSRKGTIEYGTNYKNRTRRFIKKYKTPLVLSVIAIAMIFSNIIMIINFFVNLSKLK